MTAYCVVKEGSKVLDAFSSEKKMEILWSTDKVFIWRIIEYMLNTDNISISTYDKVVACGSILYSPKLCVEDIHQSTAKQILPKKAKGQNSPVMDS